MMIYDETTVAFSHRAKLMLIEVLAEMKISVIGDKKFVLSGRYWPIEVVIFEGKELGFFNHQYMHIGLNKTLIFRAKDSVVRDILRHEIAHYITYIVCGDQVMDHGPEYRKVCKQYGFSEDVALSRMDVSEANDAKEGDLVSEKILDKVKKLLKLAQSSNAHESELATVKANELLLRHNIEMIGEKSETIYIDRVLIQKKKTPKLRAIYHILGNFVVRVVVNKNDRNCCLEVSGSRTNVMLARYIAEFLDRELDRLWEEAKKESGLSGVRSRNSFYLGVESGFSAKMKKSKTAMSESDQKALVAIDDQLKELTGKMYEGQIKTSYSRQLTDKDANEIGRQKGHNLSINQGLSSNSGSKTLAIGNK